MPISSIFQSIVAKYTSFDDLVISIKGEIDGVMVEKIIHKNTSEDMRWDDLLSIEHTDELSSVDLKEAWHHSIDENGVDMDRRTASFVWCDVELNFIYSSDDPRLLDGEVSVRGQTISVKLGNWDSNTADGTELGPRDLHNKVVTAFKKFASTE